ncbi:MAG: AraC family transcriptional regulator [Saprospiraceae bacterium]
MENRTTYTVHKAEMNVFETHEQAEQILLQFNQPVLASMVQGKKIMHLNGMESFAFLPGESVMLPSNELMCIDFPEASRINPTKCLALAIEPDTIDQVINLLNETKPKVDTGEWTMCDYNYHFANDIAIGQIIHRLIFLFTENHPAKELFVDMMLRELIIRMLQSESRHLHLKEATTNINNNRLSHVIHFIRSNIHEKLSIKTLSQQAYMSESHFFRMFKNELGLSPVDFINEERLQLAARMLSNAQRSVNDVYADCGFNSHSYFNRMFKRTFGVSPDHLQKQSGRTLVI